jgi:hypothetical protein
MSEDFDDLIIECEELPPVIEPGVYDAVVMSIKKIMKFGRPQAEFHFKLVTQGAAFNARLKGYCQLPDTKRGRLPAGSKLASWRRLVADFTKGSPNKVTLRSFGGFWFKVQVETVTIDHRQKPLRRTDQYSKVANILEVVGRLAEQKTDTRSAVRAPLVSQSGRDVKGVG